MGWPQSGQQSAISKFLTKDEDESSQIFVSKLIYQIKAVHIQESLLPSKFLGKDKWK